MGQTDQPGPMTGRSVEKGKGAVVEAPAHAESVTFRRETNQWHQDHVQCPGRHGAGIACARLGNAETVGFELGAIRELKEPEPIAINRVQNGQVAVLATALGDAAERAWINLAVIGPVKRYTAGVLYSRTGLELAGQASCGATLLLGRNPAAPVTQLSS